MARLDFEPHTITYSSPSKSLFYHAAGPKDGPLLIFIHGWPAIGLTWYPQTNHFASLGYRVLAPDMPGYGRSSSNKVITDYSQESIVEALLALLASTERKQAIWVGHDWGAGCVSSLVATHPEVCSAMAWLAVPYRTIELGLDELLRQINRDIYPEEQYPYGQWDYQKFYEENFDKATAWFDANAASFIKAGYRAGSPESLGKPAAFTSNVRKDGGFFGGAERLPPPEVIPENEILDGKVLTELTEAMQRTGFYCADAYYMNHERNSKWMLANQKNGGVLEMPCLFVQAKYDTICDTVDTTCLDKMRRDCKKFSFESLDAGHWLALEMKRETNEAIEKWLKQEVEK